MLEKNIQALAMAHASKRGCTVFRNHVGKGFMGTVIARGRSVMELISGVKKILSKHPDPGMSFVILAYPRETTFGLCVGSSDIIGITPVSGQAIFTALECKTPTGKPTTEQTDFINFVAQHGGISGIVRNNQDIDDIILKYKAGHNAAD